MEVIQVSAAFDASVVAVSDRRFFLQHHYHPRRLPKRANEAVEVK